MPALVGGWSRVRVPAGRTVSRVPGVAGEQQPQQRRQLGVALVLLPGEPSGLDPAEAQGLAGPGEPAAQPGGPGALGAQPPGRVLVLGSGVLGPVVDDPELGEGVGEGGGGARTGERGGGERGESRGGRTRERGGGRRAGRGRWGQGARHGREPGLVGRRRVRGAFAGDERQGGDRRECRRPRRAGPVAAPRPPGPPPFDCHLGSPPAGAAASSPRAARFRECGRRDGPLHRNWPGWRSSVTRRGGPGGRHGASARPAPDGPPDPASPVGRGCPDGLDQGHFGARRSRPSGT